MKRITKIAENASLGKKKIRVAAYCRVSTASEEQLVSLAAQKAHYENYIKSNDNWEFAGLYYDEGISGTKKEKRDGLLAMVAACERGMIDFVITKSISRFARNTTDCLELVRKLLDLNIYIYFEKENINTGSMESELMLSILSGLAESESVSISENEKWGIRAAVPEWHLHYFLSPIRLCQRGWGNDDCAGAGRDCETDLCGYACGEKHP